MDGVYLDCREKINYELEQESIIDGAAGGYSLRNKNILCLKIAICEHPDEYTSLHKV